ncbi:MULTISPECIES: hypothetical protein [unclassified Mycobacterium]|uniref:hypothetical protein n=1 Tax=unclassified Mycobacterium TaxID=2642494 RepID=UPI0029C6FC8F|nr:MULTISPECIES: hypothetical protein [unclassified Mycobacterium]
MGDVVELGRDVDEPPVRVLPSAGDVLVDDGLTLLVGSVVVVAVVLVGALPLPHAETAPTLSASTTATKSATGARKYRSSGPRSPYPNPRVKFAFHMSHPRDHPNAASTRKAQFSRKFERYHSRNGTSRLDIFRTDGATLLTANCCLATWHERGD